MRAVGADWIDALGYFRHAEDVIAGVPVRAVRLSYVGEAGWEMTCRTEDALRLYDALYEAGARPSGMYAQTSMRIEKRYLAMGHDLDADVTPLEAGVEFAIAIGTSRSLDATLSRAGATKESQSRLASIAHRRRARRATGQRAGLSR